MENQITPQFNQLKGILESQIAVYEQVESRMNRKRQILIDGDVDRLAQLDQSMVSLAQKLTQLEKQRMDTLTAMGYTDQSLQQVIHALPPEQSKALMPLRQQLIKGMENIQALNRQTQSLLELSMSWVAQTVDQIAKALVSETSTYNSRGNKASAFNQPSSEGMSSTIQRKA